MATETRTVKASCHCGRAAHEITLPKSSFPMNGAICHCTSCRHMTGLLCQTVVMLAPDAYKPELSLLDKLQSFAFSKTVTHYFCGVCGTNMMADEGPMGWIIALGTLEEGDASVYSISMHIFIDDTLDGGLSDFLISWEGTPLKRLAGFGPEELSLYWTSKDRAPVKQPGPDERLHAYCKCRGVKFWLAQPSARSAWPEKAFKGEPIPKDEPLPQRERTSLKANHTKFPAAVCPCDSCRLSANGQAFAQWAYVPTVDVSLDAEGKIPMPDSKEWGTIKSYSCTERTSQHFCGKCGAVIFWETKARPWIWDFGVGLFDSPDGARCESWLQWRTGEMNHREDGLKRAKELTLAVESGLAEYEKKVQSKLPAFESRINGA